MTVLVTGATGNVGRYLVKHLLAQGAHVRCLTRNPDKATFPDEVEIVGGGLNAPDTLDEAFHGVTSAHLITFAGNDYAPIPNGAAIVDRLVAAGVSRVTMLKGDIEATPIEEAVYASSLEWTSLTPVEFMTNMLEWAEGVKAGKLEEAFVDVASTVVHESDIASVAAQVLTKGGYEKETLWITGPEALTVRERLDIIEHVTGHEIELVELSAETMESQWRSYGFSDDDVSYMMQMKTNPPEASRTPQETVLRVTGKAPLSFRQWVQEHASTFSSSDTASA